jgi:hypothetical protein
MARVKTTTLSAFALVSASLGLAPRDRRHAARRYRRRGLGVASAGVNIGWRIPSQGHPPQAVAMFHDARKHFG